MRSNIHCMRIATLALYALALGGCSLPRLDNTALTQNSNSTENVVKSTNVETANQSVSNDGQKKGATYTDEGIASKVGIATYFRKPGCLRTQNAKLKNDQEILIVDEPYVLPQKTVIARIVEKLEQSCVDDDSNIGDGENLLGQTSYYRIEPVDNEVDSFSGIAILDGSKPISMDRGFVTVELTGDNIKEYFRECGSNEGMHFTVWSGKPLIGRRIWHRYYYVRYDTEFTCKEKDYEEIAD